LHTQEGLLGSLNLPIRRQESLLYVSTIVEHKLYRYPRLTCGSRKLIATAAV
jgi:hypothetical protein